MTKGQYARISESFPKHRRRASISNLDILNAVLYVLGNGCKWRCLPKEYGNWNTIYVRLRRWSKSGVLQRAVLMLQQKDIIQVPVKIISLDSTSIKVHPDGTGALKNTESRPLETPEADATPSLIWLPHPTGTL